jgi:hypothetical protein
MTVEPARGRFMSIPTFTAEASLYKSPRLYRGHSGRTKPDIGSSIRAADAASSCDAGCAFEAAAGLTICLAGVAWWNPFAAAACIVTAAAYAIECEDSCESSGGNGGGGGGGSGPPKGPCNCPVGTKCCGRCEVQMVGLKPVQICVGGGGCKATCP